MSDTKMLQTLIDGQASIRQEIKDGLKKVNDRINDVVKRLDTIGSDVAQLQDDAPTIEEHDKLKKRVTKLEHHVSSN